MATSSVSYNPAAILGEVESFFDSLPAKRRRARVEVCDEPETENYAPEPEPTITIELDRAALEQLPVLLFQLGRARSDVVAQVVTLKIYRLLGLELDGDK